MSVTTTPTRRRARGAPARAPRGASEGAESPDAHGRELARVRAILGEDRAQLIEIRTPRGRGSVLRRYRDGELTQKLRRGPLAPGCHGELRVVLERLSVSYTLARKRAGDRGYAEAARAGNAPLPGWIEEQCLREHGRRERVAREVTHPYAFLAQFAVDDGAGMRGCEQLVEQMTLAVIDRHRFGPERSRRLADRLMRDLNAARSSARVGLRSFQRALLGELKAGVRLPTLCTRGRGRSGEGEFINRDGEPDTCWLQRTIGVQPAEISSGENKRRLYKLTASREKAIRLARVCELDPVDLGL